MKRAKFEESADVNRLTVIVGVNTPDETDDLPEDACLLDMSYEDSCICEDDVGNDSGRISNH